ncbi:HAMP domain-containing sensor histidine kinase [Nocardioides sp.]|uniref:sensor histidine kinase n=1 Tax=Nocardioides sp. TaxID=35761 RepID=UPI0031FECE3C|nr:two-component system histidine kinase [Nocardioides sp.]
MRRRILTVALSAVVLAVVLLGAPLAVAIERNAFTEERGELERAALQAAVAVSPSYRTGDPVELPPVEPPVEVGLYTVAGTRVAGNGPTLLEPEVRAAGQGTVVDGNVDGVLIEAVPVGAGEEVIGVVRASSTRSSVRATVAKELLALGGLTLLALLGAGGFAFWQARRLAIPMRALADAATELGAGDFSVRPPVSGVAEIDRTSDALTATARRLSEQMDRERSFAAQASHQLRTPLTRLRLELEAGLAGGEGELDTAARDALVTADDLSQTIDDVLALAREPHGPSTEFDVEELLTECVARWRGSFAAEDRPLRLVVDGPPHASASRVAVRQVLQVLIDNAYRHGRGTVTITARESGGAVAIDVADRGSADVTWPAADATPGRLGLAMARSLAASQSGRLLLSSDSSGTRFTLLVPSGAPQPD